MRRLIAGSTTVALVIGMAAVAILGPGTASLAKVPTVTPVLNPPAGQTSIRSNDFVSFGGQTSAGATKDEALLLFKDADGNDFRDPLDVTASINIAPDGTISGDRGPINLTPEPGRANGHGGRVYLQLTAIDEVDGQEATSTSNGVPVDMVGPVIEKTRLTAPDTVVVVFNEPAYLPTQQESPADWGVEAARNGDAIVYANATDAKRIAPDQIELTIGNPQDEDATPAVRYNAGLGLVAGRETYRDTSANNAYSGTFHFLAQDLIPPRIPTVTSVAGTPGTSAISSDSTPEIHVPSCGACGANDQGIRSGHWAEIYRETSTPANGFQVHSDTLIGEDQADGSGAQVSVVDLGSDGEHTLYAVARDEALCDPPDDRADEQVCANRSGANAGSTISYVLDRVIPGPLFAAVSGVGEVTVGFTESIVGTNNASNWNVSNPDAVVTGVSGAGNRRKLTVAGAVAGATVTYTPGDHADAAGNALPGFSTTLLDQLPPLVEFTDPTFNQWVQATTYTLKGTATKANTVEIFRDGGECTPQGAAIATAPVNGGNWSIDVPLNLDSDNNFVARGIRTDTDPHINGPHICPQQGATLVQDSRNPTVSLGDLADSLGPPPFKGGQEDVDIQWTAQDDPDNFSSGPIRLEYSKDGGATWDLIAAFHPNNGTFEDWRVPPHTTKTALIRVTATDQSGRSGSDTSPAFEIDSIAPVFLPTILSPTQVGLSFSEPVSGLFTSLEWEIDGEPAGQINPVGPSTNVIDATLTTNPLAPQMDTSAPHTVSYRSAAPADETTDIRDQAGNRLIVGSGGGSGNDPVTQPTQPPATAICNILGTDGDDVLTGTDANEIICPLGGNDQVSALGGHDIIVAGSGTKTVDGGAGNDEINGGDGFDSLSGGPGEDVIFGFAGDDQMDGGDGEDILHGDEGSDTLTGAAGTDILEGEGGDDLLSGGDDIDHIAGSDGNDSLQGDDGNDRLLGYAGDDQLRGGSGNDFLEGSDGVDILKGEGGDDDLSGSAGRDHLFGDQGNDKLEGGDDNDRVDGGTGNDVVNGGDGTDSIVGGTGNDRGNGGTGNDRLEGGVGKDALIGGDGNDRLGGGSGNDSLKGSDDNDSLYGGTGQDLMLGEDGRDRLYGDEDGDRLLGGTKRDKLDGGTSRDYCNGGPGGDSKLGCEGGPNS
jgi:Ca2+-binding RTX toxin-like protein